MATLSQRRSICLCIGIVSMAALAKNPNEWKNKLPFNNVQRKHSAFTSVISIAVRDKLPHFDMIRVFVCVWGGRKINKHKALQDRETGASAKFTYCTLRSSRAHMVALHSLELIASTTQCIFVRLHLYLFAIIQIACALRPYVYPLDSIQIRCSLECGLVDGWLAIHDTLEMISLLSCAHPLAWDSFYLMAFLMFIFFWYFPFERSGKRQQIRTFRMN